MADGTTSTGARRKAILFMVPAVFLFYLGDKATKYAGKYLAVTEVLCVRNLVGILLLAGYFLWAREKPKLSVIIRDHFVLFQAAAFLATIIFFAYSFNFAPDMTPVYVISFLWPGLLVLFDFAMNGTRPRTSTAFLTATMYVGVLLYFSTPLISNIASFSQPAMLPAYGTAIGYAAFLAFGMRTNAALASIDKAFASFAFAAAGLLIVSIVQLWRAGAFPVVGLGVGLSMIGAGVASICGVLLLLKAAALGGSAEVAPMDFTIVVYAYLFDLFENKRPFSIFELAGIIVIVLGVLGMLHYAREKASS